MVPTLNNLLARSAELERRLEGFILPPPFDEPDKLVASRIMCSIAFEHAESVKVLIGAGNFTSATGLLRLQFEAFVRGMWLIYVADADSVALLMSELSDEGMVKAQKMPTPAAMLDELEGKALKQTLAKLKEFKQNSWKSLNSFVHGGIHAVNRHSKGYPILLLMQLLKASNSLSVMVCMLMSELAESPIGKNRVAEINIEFEDCLPMDSKTER
ncbi:hypothetical protein [Pseudomonas sp. H3(2019)]|uniref:DUF6988 family protein n=1 Tax=Pseudomonas sp. H3(2019) TaxID=2598724 RepID=UPI001191FEFA|nr:hypothetical protein [Pseudomonas sp. H3(2019)]TVT83961.1 hypothetical protein FPT12_10125 [Pseudomonas sp. H3(2019)]